MTLRETLLRCERTAPALLRPALPDQPMLVATARAMADHFSAMAESPPAESNEELAERLRTATDAGALDGILERDWSRAAFALWHGDRPLAADPRFLEPYLARLLRRRRRRDVSLLISAYLRSFSPDRPGLAPVTEVLRHLVPNWPWPWAKRHREHQLFDHERAPERLLNACLADDDPHEVQKQLGLEHLSEEGLVLAAQLQAGRQLERDLAAGRHVPNRLERQLRWSVSEVGISPRLRGPLADALLRPWLDRPVPDEIKQRIQDFLLKHYGDPRIRPQRWQSVSEPARQVFRKWLARVALTQFLEVIDRMAQQDRRSYLDPVFPRQWRYRRAFWTAYFDQGAVGEAQVAFGPRGAVLARQIFGKEAPFAELRQRGRKQVKADHAVLILSLGDLTIADWSHSGKCIIWRSGNRSAPNLGGSVYDSDDFDTQGADAEWSHLSSESYWWQNQVRDFIARETGVRLNDRDFQVS